ncbi:MAG: PBP1A family penicillin-binding protein [Pseudomonadota bacterium]
MRRWGKRLFWTGAFAALLGLIAVGTAVFFAAREMASYSALMESQTAQSIIVRARDGTEIQALGPSYGEWLPSDEIPQVMKDAMVSVEDHRFYSHPGVDPLGLMRAVWNALNEDRQVSATSTITQQLARNLFLNSNRTLYRKLNEIILAMALEWKFSKDQILELYLNKVYFGGGAYGVDSASRKFFSHSARELSLEEAAIIAGLVKAPSRYSPTADIDAAVGRANVVVQQMVEYGGLDPAQARQVDVTTVQLQPESGQNATRYFTDWVLPQLDIILEGDSFEPIEVWTTLDTGMQAAAASAIRANVPGGTQGALVSLDRDGAILAMVGGTDYVQSSYNRATTALRQPGSAWKLFVYLAALEAGYTPGSTVTDEPVTIDGWSPRNSNGRFTGKIDVRTAFAYSVNTVAAQLGNEVGFSNVAGMARRFGVTTEINTQPAMVLGSSEVHLLDMTRAFAAVSARGRSIEPYGIMRVTTTNGRELYRRAEPRSYLLVPDYVAAGITDLLQTAVNTGTGRAAQIGRPVAGKTGTTTSNKDGWFIGFSSGITTGVWMGRDDNRAVSGLQGGTAPARAFASYMRYAVRERPPEDFETELKLPEWQLEPDDEYYFGDEGGYYYIDEQGNLVDPAAKPPAVDGTAPVYEDGSPRLEDPPPAANDDFLEEATGGTLPAERNAAPGAVNVRRGNAPAGAKP